MSCCGHVHDVVVVKGASLFTVHCSKKMARGHVTATRQKYCWGSRSQIGFGGRQPLPYHYTPLDTSTDSGPWTWEVDHISLVMAHPMVVSVRSKRYQNSKALAGSIW